MPPRWQVANREREATGLCTVSLQWTVLHVIKVLARAAPPEDAEAFASLDVDVALRPALVFQGLAQASFGLVVLSLQKELGLVEQGLT